MSVVAAMVAGGTIGVTHALEADHLAAMATLVDEKRTSRVGVSWGIGHTVPILVVGLLFVVLGVHLPESVTQAFEVVVGIALVGYGLRLAADAAGLVTHSHDESTHSHLQFGGLSMGLNHSHLDDESLFVGVLHGLAGSGGLVVAMSTTIDGAVAFLLTFSVVTVLTMTFVATAWGRTLGSVLTQYLKGVGGVAGAAIGVALVAEVTLGVAVLP
ncbi:MAG: hypothetical protein ACI8XM_002949 [Haloarculaceae archaeon]|jgi:hypothetical protein